MNLLSLNNFHWLHVELANSWVSLNTHRSQTSVCVDWVLVYASSEFNCPGSSLRTRFVTAEHLSKVRCICLSLRPNKFVWWWCFVVLPLFAYHVHNCYSRLHVLSLVMDAFPHKRWSSNNLFRSLTAFDFLLRVSGSVSMRSTHCNKVAVLSRSNIADAHFFVSDVSLALPNSLNLFTFLS